VTTARVTPNPVDTILGSLDVTQHKARSAPRAGIVVERRRAPAMGRDAVRLNYHYLLSWEHSPVVTEQAYNGRRSTRITKSPGTLSLGLAGDLVPVQFHTGFQVIACLLDPIRVGALLDEADLPSSPPLRPHLLSEDHALATLLRLLVEETDSDGVSGKLYEDSLATAIMSRFIANAQMKPIEVVGSEAVPLPTARLRRVIDRMGSDLSEDLTLDVLARESGYSRAHFLRMFSAATGSTPHRYLTEMRLRFACDELSSGSRAITDIAHAAGFSSHSHLTKVFHQRFGVTPSEFRRAC
jgi:AraC family transcriptional regulator